MYSISYMNPFLFLFFLSFKGHANWIAHKALYSGMSLIMIFYFHFCVVLGDAKNTQRRRPDRNTH